MRTASALLLSFLLQWSFSSAAFEGREYYQVVALTNDNIKSAVRLWLDTQQNDRETIEQLYGGPIEQWNVSGITALEEVFSDTHNFHADLSQWDVSRVTSLRAAFYNTTQFAANVAAWDVSRVVDMRVLLSYSADFISDISTWNTASLQNLRAAFTEYKTTTDIQFVNRDGPDTLPISKWQTPALSDMEGLFAGTKNFHVDITGWTTSKVTSMSYMLENTVNFYGGDLSLLDTSSVETMERMFAGAVNVRAARDISKWDTANVYNMDKIFFNTTVTLDDADSAPEDTDLFYLCWDLTGLDVDTLEQAFCYSNAGGLNCDCVPEGLAENINSKCNSTSVKMCFNSLTSGEEASSLVGENDDIASSALSVHFTSWRWLLPTIASVLLWGWRS